VRSEPVDTRPGTAHMLYPLALELTILLAFWLCLCAWQKDPSTPGRTTFAALAGASILWCLGSLLQFEGAAPEHVADRIRYLGILTLPALWAGVAGQTARIELARRLPWFPLVLAAPMCVPYALLFHPTWDVLFMHTVPGGQDGYGPLFWVVVVYSYVLVLGGCGLFVAHALQTRHRAGLLQRLWLGLAALIPTVGNAIYLSRGMPGSSDPTPVLFGAALVALYVSLSTGTLLQALPITQHDLIEQLPLGVVLTDRNGMVISLNTAAERHLGTNEGWAAGRNLDAIFAEASDDLRADITPIVANGREAGQLVLIDPSSKEQA